eukprot:scaffold5659_cov121-Isochrysis_galbana.AAC.2
MCSGGIHTAAFKGSVHRQARVWKARERGSTCTRAREGDVCAQRGGWEYRDSAAAGHQQCALSAQRGGGGSASGAEKQFALPTRGNGSLESSIAVG